MITRDVLDQLYRRDRKSMQEVGNSLGLSVGTVAYWMKVHGVSRRSRSEATYVKRNPYGDPFVFRAPQDMRSMRLFAMGIGLYWGEGNKANSNSVRLGNTDPMLIRYFMDFLIATFCIRRDDFKFGLQVFSDIDPGVALDFWVKKLNIHREQINKPVVTRSGSIGTYRKKSQYGVLTVMYHNKKLRDLLVGLLPM